MWKQVKLVHNYISTLLQPVPLTATWEIAVALAHEIDAQMWFIVIDRDINMKEERMFFHRKNANTVYVYSVNRDAPRYHDVWANVILDVLSSVNYAIDTWFPQMYIFKKSNTSVIVTGWNYFINNQMVKIPETEFNTFVNWVENNIYIKDNQYYVTNVNHSDLYLVGKVYIDIAWNVVDIDMARTLNIWEWMTKEEREKLASINPNEYERISNKIAEIRSPNEATHINYPTEKAVALELEKLVPKDWDKKLTDENFTKLEKDFLEWLRWLWLENLDFSQLHKLRTNIRAVALASHNEAVSERAIAEKLANYVEKEAGKWLSANDLTNELLKLIEHYRANKDKYLKLERDVIDTIRPTKNASREKVPTERAVAEALDKKVDKEPWKGLSEINFTKEMLDKLNSLGQHEKTPIEAWTWIEVTDLWEDGYRISSNILTQVDTYGWSIDIFPMYHWKVKYIDEQKYIILQDHMRSWFYWQATFKGGKNPTVKVYYNNPWKEWKIMIDTHIRIIKADWTISETHHTIPYDVEIKHNHWMFVLKPESFRWLDYTDAEVMFIKVYRVWSHYTDKHWNEFNIKLDDLDTLKWEIRFKSMYLTYEAVKSKDEEIVDKVIDKLKDDNSLVEWYTWDLIDSNCNIIAKIENWLLKSVENSLWDNTWEVKWLNVAYKILNSIEDRNLASIVTENKLVNYVYILVEDLYKTNVFKLDSVSLMQKELERFSVTNLDEPNETYLLDWQEWTTKDIVHFLWNIVSFMKDAFWNLNWNNRCGGRELAIKENNVTYLFEEFTTSRTIDVRTATINEYRDFIYTLITDVIDSWVFESSPNPVSNKKEYTVSNWATMYTINNRKNTLKQLGNVLYTLVNDLKRTNII